MKSGHILTKTNDDFFQKIEELCSKEVSDYKLLNNAISLDDFRKILAHALSIKDKYKNFNSGDYCYINNSPVGSSVNDPYFLACSYGIYCDDQGMLVLVLHTNEKYTTKQGLVISRNETRDGLSSGTFKVGNNSLGVSRYGVEPYFTLKSQDDAIADIQNEQKILKGIHSPFVHVPLFGKIIRNEITMSAPRALSDASGVNLLAVWETPEDFWVGIKSFALGLKDLHHKQIVHSDLNPANILLMSNGIIKITDFGLSFMASSKSQNPIWDTVKKDIVPFAYTIRDLCLKEDIAEDKYVKHLYEFIQKDIIDKAELKDRISIKDFIVKLDVFLKASGLKEQVDQRIKRHIQEYNERRGIKFNEEKNIIKDEKISDNPKENAKQLIDIYLAKLTNQHDKISCLSKWFVVNPSKFSAVDKLSKIVEEGIQKEFTDKEIDAMTTGDLGKLVEKIYSLLPDSIACQIKQSRAEQFSHRLRA